MGIYWRFFLKPWTLFNTHCLLKDTVYRLFDYNLLKFALFYLPSLISFLPFLLSSFLISFLIFFQKNSFINFLAVTNGAVFHLCSFFDAFWQMMPGLKIVKFKPKSYPFSFFLPIKARSKNSCFGPLFSSF